jgi:hypothetical protein
MSTYEDLRKKALSLFENAQYKESYPLFEELAKKTDQDHDWLSVVTSSAMAGEFDVAEKAFQFLFTRITGKVEKHNNMIAEGKDGISDDIPVSPSQLLFYHSFSLAEGGNAQRALKPAGELTEIYCIGEITDDHFLYMRGVPFFANFLNLLQALEKHLGRPAIEPMLSKLLGYLDEPGKQKLGTIWKRPE